MMLVMSDMTQPTSAKKLNRVIIICTLVMVAAVVGAVGVFVWHGQKSDSKKDSATLSAEIITKVGKHYMLPSETPTVAQIKDKSSLSGNQEFYQAAENGDYVLVYKTSKLAIIYREQLDKLIKVSPVVAPEQGPAANN